MSNIIKKIIPYLLVLAVMVGVFGVGKAVKAQTTTTSPMGLCQYGDQVSGLFSSKLTETSCHTAHPNDFFGWVADTAGQPPQTATDTPKSALEENINSCRLLTGGFDACLVKLVYYLFYVIPSFFLNLIANLFNIVIPLALNGAMYSGSFIANTWVIVRDLSNMFFILVLLYIAIELILGLAHDAKKMITRVIVMALLINFSMFFTNVVIDSSNILALIFYNKIDVNATVIDATGRETTRIYVPMLKNGTIDKDISGGLVYKFDPTKFLTEEFFKKAKEQAAIVPNTARSVATGAGASIATGAAIGSLVPIPLLTTGVGAVLGGVVYALSFLGSPQVPPTVMIGILITSGLIMIFAIWAFFVASISFIGRIIELWVLIIFSPFAFMSSTIPILDRVSYIGWEEWSKRLLKTSFMAPIFMFFMYVIFKISNTNIWNDFAASSAKDQGLIAAMLFLLIPALIILVLLQQATKFAKEGGGKFADVFVGLAKVAGGLAIGAGVGLTASVVAKGAQGTLGRIGQKMSQSTKFANWKTSTDKGFGGWMKRKGGAYLRDSGKKAYTSGYDLRAGVLGGALGGLSKITGMNLGNSNLFKVEAGGLEADINRRATKDKQRVKELLLKKNEKPIQDLQKAKDVHQSLLVKSEDKIHKIDKQIEGAKAAAERSRRLLGTLEKGDKGYEEAKNKANEDAKKVNDLAAQRGQIKNGMVMDQLTGKYNTSNGEMSSEKAKIVLSDTNSTIDQKKKAGIVTSIGKASNESGKISSHDILETLNELKEARKALDKEPSVENSIKFRAIKNKYDKIAPELLTNTRNLVNSISDANKLDPNDENIENIGVVAQKLADDVAKLDYGNEKSIEDLIKNIESTVANVKKVEETKVGKSINDYEDNILPHLEHAIKDANNKRTRNFAQNLENETPLLPWPWSQFRKDEKAQSAYEIRQGIQAESHGDKGHGGGSHFSEALAAEAVGEVFEKLFTGGSGGGGGGGAKKADAGHH